MRAAIFADENRKWWTLGALSFALFMIMLDNTVVNVALPAIKSDLGIGTSELEWVVTAYALTFAVLLLTGGKLGDLYGRRLIFTIGLIVFTVSSLACGLSSSATELIAARAVQGVGSALMMPATLSIISATFAARERGMAIGIWAGVSAMALAIGPLLGGVITEHISWNWIFYVNVPIGILAVVACIEGQLARAAARPAGSAHVRDRPAGARLRTDRGAQLRVDVGPDPQPLRHRGGRAGRLRLRRDASAAADARPHALPQRDLHGGEHCRDPRHARDVRDLRLLPDLHADLPRLVADPGGRCATAVDDPDRHLRSDRRQALRPRRLTLADRGRDDDRGALLPRALDRDCQLRVLADAPWLHPRRPRDGVRDDADVRGRHGRGACRQSGGRLGRAQHLPAGRRRARDRDHGRDHHEPRGGGRPRRRRPAARLRPRPDLRDARQRRDLPRRRARGGGAHSQVPLRRASAAAGRSGLNPTDLAGRGPHRQGQRPRCRSMGIHVRRFRRQK